MDNKLSIETKQELANIFKLPSNIFDEMFIDELAASSNGEKSIVLRSPIIFNQVQETGEQKEPWEE